MDNIDLKIIDSLQVDGRITMKDLAQQVGLTSPATIERVKKLEEAGIISGYKAILNIGRAGLKIRVFILVTAESGQEEAINNFARDNKSIIGCHRVSGRATHLLEACVVDLATLEQLLNHISRIGFVEPLLVLSSPVENKAVVLP